ncbi:hypothetical protein DWZ57_21030 [Bacteroides fragilis]|nr:hypothetical protein DWZ57_21030 [Bacteroides fragilis]
MESLALSYFSGIHAFAVDTYRYLKVNQDENITNYQANRQRRYNKKKGDILKSIKTKTSPIIKPIGNVGIIRKREK